MCITKVTQPGNFLNVQFRNIDFFVFLQNQNKTGSTRGGSTKDARLYYQLFCWEINRYERQILHLLAENLNEPVLLHFHDHKNQLSTGFGNKSENPLNVINFKLTFRVCLPLA